MTVDPFPFVTTRHKQHVPASHKVTVDWTTQYL